MNSNNNSETTRAIFLRARVLIQSGWCQGPFAKDASGESVDVCSEHACQWTFSGALAKAISEAPRDARYQLNALMPHLDLTAPERIGDTWTIEDLMVWEDRQGVTQADVVSWLERTIVKLSSEKV